MSSNFVLILCGGGFALFFGALGVLLIVLNIRSKKKSEASQGWPATTAKILKSEVRKERGMEDEDGSANYYFVPHIEYEYEVGGSVYKGKKFSFGSHPSFSQQAKAHTYLAQYPLEASVNVYYDPANPQEAVLERIARSSKLGMIMGIVMLVVGLGTLAFMMILLLINYLS